MKEKVLEEVAKKIIIAAAKIFAKNKGYKKWRGKRNR